MKKLIFLVPLLLVVSMQVSCQKETNAYDELMNGLFADDGPGGVALIAKDGKILY